MTASTECHCYGCAKRIGKRGRCYVVNATGIVLCRPCANAEPVHAQLFPHCRTYHTPIGHGASHTTRAGARWLQNIH